MMGAFRDMWHKLASCLRGDITKEQLRQVLRMKLQYSKALKEDIAHFNNQEDADPPSEEYTYEYLLRCIDRHIRQTGQWNNQTSFEKQLNAQIQLLVSGKKPTMATLNQMMAAPGKGKGKGKSTIKGKNGGGAGGKGGGQPSPQFSRPCWYHNAAQYDPGKGWVCPSPIGPDGKSTCRFPHTLMRKDEWQAASLP